MLNAGASRDEKLAGDPSDAEILSQLGQLKQEIERYQDELPPIDPSVGVDASSKAFLRQKSRLFTDIAARARSWRPEAALTNSARGLAEEATFICGFMKSGTTLLRNLFDGHHQCVVLPGDSNLLKHQQKPDLNEVFLGWMSRRIAPPKSFFGDELAAYIDLINYHGYWSNQCDPGTHSSLPAIAMAMYCSDPNRPTLPSRWIEKTPGNENNVAAALDYFPRAKFIHIIRDPRANYTSVKRLAGKRGWKWSSFGAAKEINKSCRKAFANRTHYGETRYWIVSYEQLVHDTKNQMTLLADFLDIENTKELLVPTVHGKPAGANSMYLGNLMQGKVADASLTKWREHLTDRERRLVDTVSYGTKKNHRLDWDISFRDYLSGLPVYAHERLAIAMNKLASKNG